MTAGLLAWMLALISLGQGDVLKKDGGSPITVRGCVHGKTLKVTRGDTSGIQTETYKLRLTKALARALREHEGHEEEVTGLVANTERSMGGGRTKTAGKTTITVGARETRNTGAPEDPQLEVSAFRHLNPACSGSPSR